MNQRMRELSDAGVSVWLDDLSRDRLVSGNLAGLIRDYSVVGVTTNPMTLTSQLKLMPAMRIPTPAMKPMAASAARRRCTACGVFPRRVLASFGSSAVRAASI